MLSNCQSSYTHHAAAVHSVALSIKPMVMTAEDETKDDPIEVPRWARFALTDFSDQTIWL